MTTFAPALLPDEVKLDLCRELLEEFGATQIQHRRHSAELRVRCVLPTHDDRTPSADLNYSKLVYNCLSCGSSGGLLWLIGTCRGSDERQAREWLEKQSGQGPEFDLANLLRVIDALLADKPRSASPIPRFGERAIASWMLIHPYLTEVRGVPVENVRALRIGYAERYPIYEEDADGEPVERHSERVVFPHWWTIKGQRVLVGWQSRRLSDDGTPKYLSTADFPRDRTLYDYDPSRRVAVVVESPMSVARHRHHVPFEATFGASVTDSQVRLLARHERVIVWMDNDSAGWRATEGWTDEDGTRHPGLIERLNPFCDVWVVDSPWAADPGDMDEDTVMSLIDSAVPAPVWRRPTTLLCWRCRRSHAGKCASTKAPGGAK